MNDDATTDMNNNLKHICRKIIAVGRNYTEHAVELGNTASRDVPLLFSKPPSAIITKGERIEIPHEWGELHHEVELGVVIGKDGKFIREADAMDHVSGYVLALDMTARNKQEELKRQGHPWLLAKGFDTSCPISDFIPKSQVQNPNALNLCLTVNGVQKQNDSTNKMIFNVQALIAYISKYFRLEKGDLILTGTPAGVSGVRHGDIIEASISEKSNELTRIQFPVVDLDKIE